MNEGGRETFLGKGSPFPPQTPPILSKNFYQGGWQGRGHCRPAAGCRSPPLAVRERWRHGRLMKDREQEDFLSSVFFCCEFQVGKRHGTKRAIIGMGMALILGGSWAASTSLWWKAAFPGLDDDGSCITRFVSHSSGAATCHRLLPVSGGDRSCRSEQKFFRGGGEHERGRGSFYPKTPLPLSSSSH